jgi:hypothetical protein
VGSSVEGIGAGKNGFSVGSALHKGRRDHDCVLGYPFPVGACSTRFRWARAAEGNVGSVALGSMVERCSLPSPRNTENRPKPLIRLRRKATSTMCRGQMLVAGFFALEQEFHSSLAAMISPPPSLAARCLP